MCHDLAWTSGLFPGILPVTMISLNLHRPTLGHAPSHTRYLLTGNKTIRSLSIWPF